MADVAAAQGGEQAAGAPTMGDRAMYFGRQLMMYYLVSNLVTGMLGGNKGASTGSQRAGVSGDSAIQRMALPMWDRGESMDMYAYVTYAPTFDAFGDHTKLIAHDAEIPLCGNGIRAMDASNPGVAPDDGAREYSLVFPIPEDGPVWSTNSTPYLHVFLTKTGSPHDPSHESYDEKAVVPVPSTPLITYRPKRKRKAKKNLLGHATDGGGADMEEVIHIEEEETEETEDEEAITGWLPYWKPNVTVSTVDDFNGYPYPRGVPVHMRDTMRFHPETLEYWPTVYVNEFWLLKDAHVPLNASVAAANLTLTVAPLSMFKWQLYEQMERTFEHQRAMGTQGENDGDELKRIFLEGNPILLAVTSVVSVFHTVFDVLAFKNDIGFWRQNKSMEGLSARTITFNAGCQAVIFMYLLDNDTSWMVLLSSGLGLIIEGWKITKAMDVSVKPKFPFVHLRDKFGYTKSDTARHDEVAMRYLSYALYPLVGCYAVYSVVYNEHRSWYSFVLNTLVGAVYLFGFITMCPQLYINYKLKSVAHLPWRQMTYKFLNTIIDDLFAFVIKMPAMHRLSVFRDDVVFLIFLYQRRIYRVDKTRVNEFGFSGEASEVDAIDEAKGDDDTDQEGKKER